MGLQDIEKLADGRYRAMGVCWCAVCPLALGTSRLFVGVFELTDRVAVVVWAVLWLRHRIRGTA